jgi:hypothetical protein
MKYFVINNFLGDNVMKKLVQYFRLLVITKCSNHGKDQSHLLRAPI